MSRAEHKDSGAREGSTPHEPFCSSPGMCIGKVQIALSEQDKSGDGQNAGDATIMRDIPTHFAVCCSNLLGLLCEIEKVRRIKLTASP